MTHIVFEDKQIELKEGQTVLSALLEQGNEIPNSCQAGVCQTCLMQALEGEVPEAAQAGLKDTLKAQGYFLACSCIPTSPLRVAISQTDALQSLATVVDHQLLAKDILRLRLKPEQAYEYRAGQYLTIWKTDKLGRSYSLASVPAIDDFLELHIRRIPEGIVSNWLHDEVKVGDTIQIQAATGNCFYTPGAAEQKMLLTGTGTGLAPLIGIIRDALLQGHKGEMQLIHGAVRPDDLYLHDALVEMMKHYPQFHYHASVLQADEPAPRISSQPIDEVVGNAVADPAGWRIYLCGDVNMVNNLKRKLFLAGASMGDIYTDPFVSSADAEE